MEVLEGVLEVVGDVLEAEMRQDCQERAKKKIPSELPSGLKPPGYILAVLGDILNVFGGVWKALERASEASWKLLEAFWRPKCAKITLKCLRSAPRTKFLGNFRTVEAQSKLLGHVLGALGGFLEASYRSKMAPRHLGKIMPNSFF